MKLSEFVGGFYINVAFIWGVYNFIGYSALHRSIVYVYLFRLCEMRWVYLIKGVTETAPAKDQAPARIHTKARQRTEMRLEVTLTGCVGGPKQVMRCRHLSEFNENKPQQIIVGEGRRCRRLLLSVSQFFVIVLLSLSVCLSVCLSACSRLFSCSFRNTWLVGTPLKNTFSKTEKWHWF